MTFPRKTTPLARRFNCAVMGPTEEANDPETPYRGADHRGVEGYPQAGVSVQNLCRKHDISDTTFYTWRTKYAGLEVSDVKKLRQLEEENRCLKQMVAEHALDIQALKAIIANNWYGPRRRGQRHGVSSHALSSASGECAGSWTWIGTRCGTAVDDGTTADFGRGFERLRRASGVMDAPESRCGCGGKSDGRITRRSSAFIGRKASRCPLATKETHVRPPLRRAAAADPAGALVCDGLCP